MVDLEEDNRFIHYIAFEDAGVTPLHILECMSNNGYEFDFMQRANSRIAFTISTWRIFYNTHTGEQLPKKCFVKWNGDNFICTNPYYQNWIRKQVNHFRRRMLLGEFSKTDMIDAIHLLPPIARRNIIAQQQ